MATDADNPTLLQVLVLERVDRTKNMARFYVLSIELTLFEDLALVRRWGRIGSAGRKRIDLHPSRRSRRWSSRNGSIARGAADTSSGPDGRPRRAANQSASRILRPHIGATIIR